MSSIGTKLSNGFVLFIGWIVAVLAVLICLVTLEYVIFGSFSWNYDPEIDPILAKNS